MGTIGRPRSQAAHDTILKAALRLVMKRGFRAVSVDEIAATAGVGKMTIYRHWPNKAALVIDALVVLIGGKNGLPGGNQRHRKPSQAVGFTSDLLSQSSGKSYPFSCGRSAVRSGVGVCFPRTLA